MKYISSKCLDLYMEVLLSVGASRSKLPALECVAEESVYEKHYRIFQFITLSSSVPIQSQHTTTSQLQYHNGKNG